MQSIAQASGVREVNTGGIPFAGGVLLPLPEDRSWPRTELPALPSCQRTLHDTTGDNIADVVLTTRVKLIDLDDNGVADAIHLRVIGGEAIQSDVAFECGEAQRFDALNRVASGL